MRRSRERAHGQARGGFERSQFGVEITGRCRRGARTREGNSVDLDVLFIAREHRRYHALGRGANGCHDTVGQTSRVNSESLDAAGSWRGDKTPVTCEGATESTRSTSDSPGRRSSARHCGKPIADSGCQSRLPCRTAGTLTNISLAIRRNRHHRAFAIHQTGAREEREQGQVRDRGEENNLDSARPEGSPQPRGLGKQRFAAGDADQPDGGPPSVLALMGLSCRTGSQWASRWRCPGCFYAFTGMRPAVYIAFTEDDLYGWLCLLFPFYAAYYVVSRWDEIRRPADHGRRRIDVGRDRWAIPRVGPCTNEMDRRPRPPPRADP